MKNHLSLVVWSDESLGEASNPHIRLGCRGALSAEAPSHPPRHPPRAAETFPELRPPLVGLGKDAFRVISVCSVWGFVFLCGLCFCFWFGAIS